MRPLLTPAEPIFFTELSGRLQRTARVHTRTTLTACSNVGLRLPRVRGLSASMVDEANFSTKEYSYV
jgi:hypothetical protein